MSDSAKHQNISESFQFEELGARL